MAYAPKSAIDKGLKSNEWCGSVLGLINGKGGGKADNAQASGTSVAALRPAMEAAESYALGKLGVPRVQPKTGSSGDAGSSGTKAAAGAVVRGPAQSAGVQLVQVCAKYAGSAVSFQPAGSFSFQVAKFLT